MTQKKPFRTGFLKLIGSRHAFRLVVALLVLQAAWIALVSRYPMAFDENFHLGVIRLYASHLSPFWDDQPAGADAFGAVARDPSYLYHWLMSFPYRLITLFTSNETVVVLWLRGLNVALLAVSLPLFRRLLLRLGSSPALANLCLLLFVLVPVTPLLAAQINYDNLLIAVIALMLLLAHRLSRQLKTGHAVDLRLAGGLLLLCLLASLIKYAFLPVFVAVGGYLLIRGRLAHAGWGELWKQIVAGGRLLSRRSAILLVIGLIIAAGLFAERYGLNLARYHTPAPECGQVLDYDHCSAYGPWIRDYHLSHPLSRQPEGALVFTADWFYGMWLRSFFAVAGPTSHFQTRGPLVVPGVGAIVFFAASIGLLAIYGQRLFRRYDAQLLTMIVLAAGGYLAALWLTEYKAYNHTGQPVAINGRYLLPVLPLLFGMSGLAFREALAGRRRLKAAAAGLAVLSLLWGGGALTYVLRSNDAWYWPDAPRLVYDLNHAAQDVLGPITPGYRRPTQFLR